MKSQKVIHYDDFFIKKNAVTKVLVGGCFDLIHIGHIRFLQAAKKQGDLLIVALESDQFIINKKQRQPLHTQLERAEIISHIDCVDMVVLLPYFESEADYEVLVRLISPAVIAVTENDPQIEKKQKQAESVGGRLEIVTPIVSSKATKDLIKLIKKIE